MDAESPPPNRASLAGRLAELFTPREVDVELRPALETQASSLDFPWPNEKLNSPEYFAELVAALERRGMVDGEFLDVLAQLRPRRESFIRELRPDLDRRGLLEARPRRSSAPLQQVLGGRYVLLACERARGATTDWKAQDREDGSYVTLTTLNANVSDDPGIRARFDEQARRILAIDHPALPRTIRLCAGEHESPYLVSEWIAGVTLRAWVGESTSTQGLDAEWLAAMDAVGGALTALHGVGLTHFYLQPDTVILDEEDRWRLIAVTPLPEPRRTAGVSSSLVPVDRRYVSPEEQTAQDVCDARADLYSLARIALLIHTRREPPLAGTSGSLRGEWAAIQRARAMQTSSSGLRSAFSRALHDDTAKRPTSVREFVLELHHECDPPATRPTEVRRAAAGSTPTVSNVPDAAVLARRANDLFLLARLMHASRPDALESLRGFAADPTKLLGLPATFLPQDVLIAGFARALEEKLGRKVGYEFQMLDDVLRGDITGEIDVSNKEIDGDPRRVHPLLWELKRTCLYTVLGCLAPGVRIAFILVDVFAYPPVFAAELLGITESAFRVRLTRARNRLDSYLTPRCQHVDHQNPCNCEGRLMRALDLGFIGYPAYLDDIPHSSHRTDVEHREMGSLYRSLPHPILSGEEYAQVLQAARETRAGG